MTLPTISKEQAIVWLRMLSRACALVVTFATALQMSEWMIALTVIIGQLAVERLAMFSNHVIDQAHQEPNRLQEQQIAALEYQLRKRDEEIDRLRPLQSYSQTVPTIPLISTEMRENDVA